MKKVISSIILCFVFSFFFVPSFALSATGEKRFWEGPAPTGGTAKVTKAAVVAELGLKDQNDPRIIVARIIKFLLGFLGIVAVSLIFYAGWKWMMSKGAPDEIKSSRDIMISAVIGLAFIIGAYSIADMILDSLLAAGLKAA